MTKPLPIVQDLADLQQVLVVDDLGSKSRMLRPSSALRDK